MEELEKGGIAQVIETEMGFLEIRQNGKSRGSCFIPFLSADDCTRALNYLSSIEIAGKKVNVSYAPPKQTVNPFRDLKGHGQRGSERTMSHGEYFPQAHPESFMHHPGLHPAHGFPMYPAPYPPYSMPPYQRLDGYSRFGRFLY